VLAIKDEAWREVDQQLRSIARRRAGLDAQEARLLRRAKDVEIWVQLGMVSALDYVERVLGYAPHAGAERLRVADALAQLPALERALEAGELNYSAVRELTRVATPATEEQWCARAIGKNVRQIEELVAGRRPGSLPDDPADPQAKKHVIRWEIDADAFAQLRQTQSALADEHGGQLDASALVRVLCDRALEPAGGEPSGRAKFQIMLKLCAQCERGTQEGAGVEVPVDAATVERARCDAQYIGSVNDAVPVRATQDVPPSVVRFVWRRDGGRCQTPGCRSSRALEVHHIVLRADGGSHDASNLRLQCSACHSSIHRGTLEIRDGEVRRPKQPVPQGTELDAATTRVQVRDALVGLGWKSAVARAAVNEALAVVGNAPLDELLREALRRCHRPSS
jgi:hypothetical protein